MDDKIIKFKENEITVGRQIIYTPYLSESMVVDNGNIDEDLIITTGNIDKVVNDVLTAHYKNSQDIQKLKNYYLGVQPILDRKKVVRSDVDNKAVLNFAWSTTRQINGYTFGKPVVYTQRGTEASIKNSISILNDMMEEIDKHSVDMSIEETASICGTSYLCCLPSSSVVGADDTIPYHLEELEPENTAIAYYSEAHTAPVIAISYYKSLYNNIPCYILNAYTSDYIYIFRTASSNVDVSIPSVTLDDLIDVKPNILNAIPIIEYPNNKWRVGDWEPAIGIFNAINSITSDNVNDIQQFVSSILVLLNAELPENEEEDPLTGELVPVTDYSSVLQGILSLTNEQGVNTDAKYISKQLDASSIKQITSLLMSAYTTICGIPDRKTQETAGDTGQAVEMRDGWEDFNILANGKETWYRKSEKKLLKVILTILSIDDFEGFDKLKVNDIIIKFNRNKSDNLVTKANFISLMNGTNKFDIVDVIDLAGITSDSKGMAERGEAYQKKMQKEAIENMPSQEGQKDLNNQNKPNNLNNSNENE